MVAYTDEGLAKLIVRSTVRSTVIVRSDIEVQYPRPSSTGVGFAGKDVTVRSNNDVW